MRALRRQHGWRAAVSQRKSASRRVQRAAPARRGVGPRPRRRAAAEPASPSSRNSHEECAENTTTRSRARDARQRNAAPLRLRDEFGSPRDRCTRLAGRDGHPGDRAEVTGDWHRSCPRPGSRDTPRGQGSRDTTAALSGAVGCGLVGRSTFRRRSHLEVAIDPVPPLEVPAPPRHARQHAISRRAAAFPGDRMPTPPPRAPRALPPPRAHP